MAILLPQQVLPNPLLQLAVADAMTQVIAGDTKGSKLYNLGAYNDDDIEHTVELQLVIGGSVAKLGKVSVPAGATVNLIAPENIPAVQADGSLIVGPTASLAVTIGEAINTGGSLVHIFGSAASYTPEA